MAITPSSSVIPTAALSLTSSLLTPYNNGNGQPVSSSSASPYPVSSLTYPKTPSIVGPPSWTPQSASPSPSTNLVPGQMNRPTPPAMSNPGAQFGSSPLFTAPLPPPVVPTSAASAPHPFSTESLLTNKGKK